MLNYLYANNFKSFVNFRIEFNQINLLMGKNGTGKSSVFALTFSLVSLIKGQNDALRSFFPQTSLTRWSKSQIQSFELGMSDDDHVYVYSIEIEQDVDQVKTKILSEKVTCDGNELYKMSEGNAILYDDHHNGLQVLTDYSVSGVSYAPIDSRHTMLTAFRNQANNIIFCSPDSKSMTDVVQNEEFGIKVDLSNIASAYSGIVQTDTEVYSELMGILKDINPNLKKYSVVLSPIGRYLEAVYQYKDIECHFRFSELSDGEKMVFALYLILYGLIKKGYTVLLDEPDNYLSLREIQPWCNEMESEMSKKGQCILISHHPEVIDHFAASNGIWLSRLSSGESVIKDNPQKNRENEDLLKYSELIARGLMDEA